MPHRKLVLAAAGLLSSAALVLGLTSASADPPSPPRASTPVQHLVVIFDENISFDHYFGTYPNATNEAGEPAFAPKPGTPSVNGLNTTLLKNNPNAANPARLDRSQAVTCDQGHGYGAEQKAADAGLMDRSVEFTAGGSCTDRSIVMDYYDGNTVTGLWNLAQNFAMSDNSFNTVFGPSTPGALNLVSGQTHGAGPGSGVENGSVIGDPDPALDDCGNGSATLTGKNVGDLLNAHHLTWGWFQGGFKPTSTSAGKAVCGSSHVNVGGASVTDYSPHHNPFEYYASTANPHHLPPSSTAAIGATDQANHEYDLTDFDAALHSGHLPAVSYLKASEYQDGHAGYSDPLDEQAFIAHEIDELEHSPDWSSTAVVIAYDDSDGWYDHVMSPIVSPSAAPSDALNGPGACGNVKDPSAYPDRCGYGPRLPLMVISPWAKQNYVDGTLTDQSSILRYIEDNWQLGRIGDQSFDARAGSLGSMFDYDPNHARAPKVFLDETTGQVVHASSGAPAGGTHGAAHHGSTGPAAGSSGRRAHVTLRCSVARSGRRLTVSCRATGGGLRHGETAVRYRLLRGSTVLATARTLLRHGRAGASLRVRHRLAPGRYTLRISLARRDGVTGMSRALRLR